MALTSRHSARRLQLIEVARSVLIEEGLEGFVVRRIAELADVRLGNLQYYFPTRIDLLAAVVRHELGADLDSLTGATDDDAEAELRDLLHALIDRWAEGATDVYLPAALLALHDATMAQVIDEAWLTFYEAIAERVRLIDTDADPDEAWARAVVITSLLDGASLQRIDAAGIDRGRFVARTIEQAVAIARGPR